MLIPIDEDRVCAGTRPCTSLDLYQLEYNPNPDVLHTLLYLVGVAIFPEDLHGDAHVVTARCVEVWDIHGAK